MSRSPKVNQRVDVLVEGEVSTLSSRVEDTGPGVLVLALPSNGKAVIGIPPDRSITVQWATPRGLGRTAGRVRGMAELGIPVLVVDLLGKTEIVQRRQDVRAQGVLDIRVVQDAAAGSVPVSGTILDLSRSGMRARVPAQLDAGDIAAVVILVPKEEPVETIARVVRRVDEETLAFCFTQIFPQDRERLVRLVFQWLRRSLVTRDP